MNGTSYKMTILIRNMYSDSGNSGTFASWWWWWISFVAPRPRGSAAELRVLCYMGITRGSSYMISTLNRGVISGSLVRWECCRFGFVGFCVCCELESVSLIFRSQVGASSCLASPLLLLQLLRLLTGLRSHIKICTLRATSCSAPSLDRGHLGLSI